MQRLAGLEERFPGLDRRLYLVSCEEAIEDIDDYVSEKPCATSTEKEHVLVALQVTVAGRRGFMLLDPGYHVARVVTVMADGQYPHTGWFTQSDEPHSRKEYQYTSSSDGDYVVWMDRETRAGIEKISVSVLYVARPFLAPIDVTERRNLVYNFRSLLARDTKGHLVAGMYFKIFDCGDIFDEESGLSFTVFYQAGSETKRFKIPFSRYLGEKRGDEDAIAICGLQLGFPSGKLESMLASLAGLLSDVDFRTQLLRINADINAIADDN